MSKKYFVSFLLGNMLLTSHALAEKSASYPSIKEMIGKGKFAYFLTNDLDTVLVSPEPPKNDLKVIEHYDLSLPSGQSSRAIRKGFYAKSKGKAGYIRVMEWGSRAARIRLQVDNNQQLFFRQDKFFLEKKEPVLDQAFSCQPDKQRSTNNHILFNCPDSPIRHLSYNAEYGVLRYYEQKKWLDTSLGANRNVLIQFDKQHRVSALLESSLPFGGMDETVIDYKSPNAIVAKKVWTNDIDNLHTPNFKRVFSNKRFFSPDELITFGDITKSRPKINGPRQGVSTKTITIKQEAGALSASIIEKLKSHSVKRRLVVKNQRQ